MNVRMDQKKAVRLLHPHSVLPQLQVSRLDSDGKSATGKKRKQLVVDIAYNKILEMIKAGDFLPTGRVKREELTKKLGLSGTPVREAIMRLVGDGILDYEPNKGAVVRRRTLDEINEILELRAVLESVAAGRLARADKKVRSKVIERLEELVILMDVALERRDMVAHKKYEVEFHTIILENGTDSFLREAVKGVNIVITSLIFPDIDAHMSEEFQASMKTVRVSRHEPIIQAIRSADAKTARAVTMDHLLHDERFS